MSKIEKGESVPKHTVFKGESFITKYRLQLDFNDVALKEIDKLRAATALPSRAELIRQALRFLQWTLDETRKGSTLLIEKNGKLREVIFPFWTIPSSARVHEEGDNGARK